MGGILAAEQGGVPHAAVVGVHVNLGSHAAGLTVLRACFHLCPHLHVLLHGCTQERDVGKCVCSRVTSCTMPSISQRTVVSALGLDALLPLLLHLLGGRVVDVGLARGEQLFAIAHDDGKTVAGVGELVWLDLQHGNIFQDDLRRFFVKFR